MNHILKRLVSLILICAMIFSSFPTALAAEVQEVQIAGYVNNQETLSVSASEAKKYACYEVQPILMDEAIVSEQQQMDAAEPTTSEDIESLCSVTERTELTGVNEGTQIVIYSSETLQDNLEYCREITEISKIGDYIYVSYCSTDGKEIILTYSEDGLVENLVYDPVKDIAVLINSEGAVKYTHFREGEHYEMPEDVSAQIDEYMEAGEWDKIEAMDGITVIDCGDGCYAVEPELDTGRVPISDTNGMELMSATAPSSNSDLLKSLKNEFPMYTGKVLTNTTKKCTSINKTVKVRVTSDCNSYSKKSADWKTFLAGMTVTAISVGIGWPLDKTTKVLTALSVIISAKGTISEQVKLNKEAVYTYKGKKIGYVYDTTKYKKYVRVKTYQGTGEFSGGYNSKGKFDWQDNRQTPIHTVKNSTVVDKAAYLYDRDVDTNGVCYNYYPD